MLDKSHIDSMQPQSTPTYDQNVGSLTSLLFTIRLLLLGLFSIFIINHLNTLALHYLFSQLQSLPNHVEVPALGSHATAISASVFFITLWSNRGFALTPGHQKSSPFCTRVCCQGCTTEIAAYPFGQLPIWDSLQGVFSFSILGLLHLGAFWLSCFFKFEVASNTFSCQGLVLCGLIHLGVFQSLWFFQFKIIDIVFPYLHFPIGLLHLGIFTGASPFQYKCIFVFNSGVRLFRIYCWFAPLGVF